MFPTLINREWVISNGLSFSHTLYMCGLFSSPQLLVRICIISERVSSHNVGLPLELAGKLRHKIAGKIIVYDSSLIPM